jgi:hypothetical protein
MGPSRRTRVSGPSRAGTTVPGHGSSPTASARHRVRRSETPTPVLRRRVSPAASRCAPHAPSTSGRGPVVRLEQARVAGQRPPDADGLGGRRGWRRSRPPPAPTVHRPCDDPAARPRPHDDPCPAHKARLRPSDLGSHVPRAGPANAGISRTRLASRAWRRPAWTTNSTVSRSLLTQPMRSRSPDRRLSVAVGAVRYVPLSSFCPAVADRWIPGS